MGLSDEIRTHNTAAADFSFWMNRPNLADPLRRAACVLAALAGVMAQVLDTQARSMTAVTDRMAIINEVLKKVNELMAENKAKGEHDLFRFMETQDKAEIDRLFAVLTAEGVDPSLYSMQSEGTGAATVWYFQTNRNILTSMQTTLQISLDTLGSTSQSDQLRVQTGVGRYNGTFELVSSLIKKAEAQAESATAGIKG